MNAITTEFHRSMVEKYGAQRYAQIVYTLGHEELPSMEEFEAHADSVINGTFKSATPNKAEDLTGDEVFALMRRDK